MHNAAIRQLYKHEPAPNDKKKLSVERHIVDCWRKLTYEGKHELLFFAEGLVLDRINRRLARKGAARQTK